MIQIFNWCGERRVFEAITKLGYQHTQQIKADPFEVAKQFFNEGFSVMLKHMSNGVTLVAVDTKTFQQR